MLASIGPDESVSELRPDPGSGRFNARRFASRALGQLRRRSGPAQIRSPLLRWRKTATVASAGVPGRTCGTARAAGRRCARPTEAGCATGATGAATAPPEPGPTQPGRLTGAGSRAARRTQRSPAGANRPPRRSGSFTELLLPQIVASEGAVLLSTHHRRSRPRRLPRGGCALRPSPSRCGERPRRRPRIPGGRGGPPKRGQTPGSGRISESIRYCAWSSPAWSAPKRPTQIRSPSSRWRKTPTTLPLADAVTTFGSGARTGALRTGAGSGTAATRRPPRGTGRPATGLEVRGPAGGAALRARRGGRRGRGLGAPYCAFASRSPELVGGRPSRA